MAESCISSELFLLINEFQQGYKRVEARTHKNTKQFLCKYVQHNLLNPLIELNLRRFRLM